MFSLLSSARGLVRNAPELLIEDLPFECIAQVGSNGDKTMAAMIWKRRLQFTVDEGYGKRHLLATGGWTVEELRAMLADEVAGCILWLACCDFHEYRQNPARGGNAFQLAS